VRFQTRPAGKSVFAGDCELRAAELEVSGEDFRIVGVLEMRMKLPDPL
jgi:hypothetical protein